MTFRTDKHHRIQESEKSKKSVLKLASKLQHFLNTGKASKQDLKAIDKNFQQTIYDNGRKIWQMLEEVQLRIPKAKGKDTIDSICTKWAKWLDEIRVNAPLGYCDLKLAQGSIPSALLEATIDADSDLFRLLISYDSMMDDCIKRSSYVVPNVNDIAEGAEAVLEAYVTRQNLMSRLSA